MLTSIEYVPAPKVRIVKKLFRRYRGGDARRGIVNAGEAGYEKPSTADDENLW
jgi:hypothetical protein